MTHTADYDAALKRLRVAHEPQAYEFKTSQTYCPAFDGPSDQCDVCMVLTPPKDAWQGLHPCAGCGVELDADDLNDRCEECVIPPGSTEEATP
jgi:hypothetical protein